MPQLHFYVAEPVAKALRDKAKLRRIPVSRYLAEVAARDVKPVTTWPKDYFTRVLGGGWSGGALPADELPLDEPPKWAK